MSTYQVRNEAGQQFEVDQEKAPLAEKDGYLPVVSNGQEEHRVSVSDLSKAAKDGYHPLNSTPAAPAGQSITDAIRGAVQHPGDTLSALGQGAQDLGGNILHAAGNAGQGLYDFARETQHSVPFVSPLVEQGIAKAAPLVSDMSEQQMTDAIAQDAAERQARSPIATQLGHINGAVGGTMLPGNNLPGIAGVAAGLGYSAGDQALTTGIDPANLGLQAGIGLGAAVLAPKVLRPVADKAEEVANYLKSKFGEGSEALIKKLLGRKSDEIQKDLVTAVRGNDSVNFDEIAKKVRDTGAFDNFVKPNNLPVSMEDRAAIVAQANNDTGKAVGAAREGRHDINPDDMAKYLEDQANALKASPTELNPEKVNDIQSVRNNLLSKKDAGLPTISPDMISNSKSTYQDLFRQSGEKNVSAGNKADIFKDLERQSLNDPSLSDEDNAKRLANFDTASREHVLTSKGLEKLSDLTAKGQGKNMGTWSQIIRNNTATLGAVGLNKLTKVDLPVDAARSLADALERGGGAAVMSTHYLLMQQNPEYRKAVAEADKVQSEDAIPGKAVYSTEQ